MDLVVVRVIQVVLEVADQIRVLVVLPVQVLQ